MRDDLHNETYQVAIPPVVVTDNTAQVGAWIDRLGYESLTFGILTGNRSRHRPATTAASNHKSAAMPVENTERQLWIAVILQAIKDATQTQPASRPAFLEWQRNKDEAIKWLTMPNSNFDAVCGMAGLDPERTRSGIVAYLESAPTNGKHRLRQPITFNHVTDDIKGWARRVGISYQALINRLEKGMSIDQALTQPDRSNRGVGCKTCRDLRDRRGSVTHENVENRDLPK